MLSAGHRTSFNVKFAPTAAGAATGNVSIVINAPGSPLAIPENVESPFSVEVSVTIPTS
jgi:hypothetical protein